MESYCLITCAISSLFNQQLLICVKKNYVELAVVVIVTSKDPGPANVSSGVNAPEPIKTSGLPPEFVHRETNLYGPSAPVIVKVQVPLSVPLEAPEKPVIAAGEDWVAILLVPAPPGLSVWSCAQAAPLFAASSAELSRAVV